MADIRIKRPEEQDYIYKAMTEKKEIGIFSSYKDFFMLSLVVGFLEGKRKSFTKSAEGIPLHIFRVETDEPVMNAIAFIELQDFNILYSEHQENWKQKVQIIEEYAAAGAEVLYGKVMENETKASEILATYLLEFEEYKQKNTAYDTIREILPRF